MHYSRYIIFHLLLISLPLSPFAQPAVDAYLAAHRYTFTLDSGFDARTRDSLRTRLGGYRLLLQAEGGSHDLSFYDRLPMVWIAFLNRQFGLTRFFFEGGHSSDVLERQYLHTGDSSFILVRDKTFWKDLYAYDQTLSEDRRVTPGGGVDFERARTCVPALKFLWKHTARALPESLRSSDRLIAAASDTTRNCDTLLALTRALAQELSRHEEDFGTYMGASYTDFVDILRNPGSCKDVYRDRNGHMATRLVDFASGEKDPIYYGEFGEAHTVLNVKGSLGHLVDKTPGWEGKVCTVNLYCYQCTSDEPVSNWPLKKIEPDILAHFLPLCEGDFTLFDVTGLSEYSAYGAFLIIARGQH